MTQSLYGETDRSVERPSDSGHPCSRIGEVRMAQMRSWLASRYLVGEDGDQRVFEVSFDRPLGYKCGILHHIEFCEGGGDGFGSTTGSPVVVGWTCGEANAW